MKTKSAFITGITGQDGSYLAELLLEKGYEVHGLIRKSSTFNTSRIDHIYQDRHSVNPKLFLHYGDMTDGFGLTNLLRSIQPDEVYNLAAQSHVQVSFKIPLYTAHSNALGSLGLLEAIRSAEINTKYYQASTSELFGNTPPPQNEKSQFQPRSPYAAAKLMAYWNTVNYREAYGVHATNGILFNHESPRRGETFVTRKITRAVALAAKGSKEKLFLGNLEATRDWGYAPEYVNSMWMMLQQPSPSDYVIATGVGATVEQFVEKSFALVGLNWRDYVSIDKEYLRPTEVNALIGNPEKAFRELGWKAETHWDKLAEIMVMNDLK